MVLRSWLRWRGITSVRRRSDCRAVRGAASLRLSRGHKHGSLALSTSTDKTGRDKETRNQCEVDSGRGQIVSRAERGSGRVADVVRGWYAIERRAESSLILARGWQWRYRTRERRLQLREVTIAIRPVGLPRDAAQLPKLARDDTAQPLAIQREKVDLVQRANNSRDGATQLHLVKSECRQLRKSAKLLGDSATDGAPPDEHGRQLAQSRILGRDCATQVSGIVPSAPQEHRRQVREHT